MTDSPTWSTDDDLSYDINKFYIRGDKAQVTKQVRVYLPLDQIAMMEELVQGKSVVEYRTLQDIVRDALHHRLRWVDKERVQTPESAIRTRMMQLKADAENKTRELAENNTTLEAIKRSLSEMHQTGDRDLGATLARLELEAHSMAEPWKWELLELVQTYGGEVV